MDLSHYEQESAVRQQTTDIDLRTAKLRQQLGRGGSSWPDFQQLYDISWIYHENGLEGVVLSYPEIRSAVDNKIISDVSLLPTYRDIKNQKACMDDIRQKADKKTFFPSVDYLVGLHAKLTPTPPNQPIYRKDIPIHRTYFHEIAPPQRILPQFAAALEDLAEPADADLHPVEFAAIVHHRYMRAFPFTHHSGMIGRLLLSFALHRAHYLPVIIHSADRQRYYEALRGSERDFRLFILEAMENSLDNAVRFLAFTQTRPSSRAL
jgi:Fic family protein